MFEFELTDESVPIPYNIKVWEAFHEDLLQNLSTQHISSAMLETIGILLTHHEQVMKIANMYAGAFNHSELNSQKKTHNMFSDSLN